jgi:predicted RNA-binding Zn ribbon-like protein
MLRDSLDALTARRFRTGRPCLDFVHTGGVGRFAAAELVHDPADAAFWLAVVLDLDVEDVRVSLADVGPMRELREGLWQLAQAAVTGRPFAAEHVAVVNAAAGAAPLRIAMTEAGESRTVRPVDAAQALSAIAGDAVDLFTGPLRERVRTCGAEDCELLFVDMSRSGCRQWCSMARCGSRAKMRRYRAS